MTGRPVKLQLDRRETILCTVLRHPIKSEIRAKFDKGHILKALDLTAELDAGGYQGVSPDYMGSMFKKLSWVYGVEDVAYHATSTCTNTPMSGSYRGWGRPRDRVHHGKHDERRPRRNSAVTRSSCGSKISCRPTQSAKLAISRSAMSALRTCCALAVNVSAGSSAAPPRRRRIEAARYLKGVGLAVSTHTSGYYPRRIDWCTVTAKFEEDGSASFNCNIHDHGCGTVAALKNIAAEELSIPPDSMFP